MRDWAPQGGGKGGGGGQNIRESVEYTSCVCLNYGVTCPLFPPITLILPSHHTLYHHHFPPIPSPPHTLTPLSPLIPPS